jgi:hypothetical protein
MSRWSPVFRSRLRSRSPWRTGTGLRCEAALAQPDYRPLTWGIIAPPSSFGITLHEPARPAMPDTDEISQVPYKGRLHVHGVSDCARSIPYLPSVAWDDVAFSSTKWIGTSERPVSQLNTQPIVSPVNASRQPSRTAAHHSGPGRLARPYPVVDFHLLFEPSRHRCLVVGLIGCRRLAARTD